MNILIDDLPYSVDIHGTQHEIHPEFRFIVLAEQAINNTELTEVERIACALDLFFVTPPSDILAAMGAFTDFFACYKQPKKTGKGKPKALPAVLSSEHDAPLIFSAFMRTYGINLNSVKNLHWFEYQAMLDDLDEGCRLSKIMEYRGANLSDVKSPEMKKFYTKMKKQYAIPLDKRTQEQMDSLRDVLINGGDLQQVLEEGR